MQTKWHIPSFWDIILEVVLLSIFTEIFDTCSQMALQKYCTAHTFSESSGMLSAAKEQQSPIQTGFKKDIYLLTQTRTPVEGTICTAFTQLHFFERHWLGINNKLHVDSLENNGLKYLDSILELRQEATWANSDLGTGGVEIHHSSTRVSKAHCSQALPSLDITSFLVLATI